MSWELCGRQREGPSVLPGTALRTLYFIGTHKRGGRFIKLFDGILLVRKRKAELSLCTGVHRRPTLQSSDRNPLRLEHTSSTASATQAVRVEQAAKPDYDARPHASPRDGESSLFPSARTPWPRLPLCIVRHWHSALQRTTLKGCSSSCRSKIVARAFLSFGLGASQLSVSARPAAFASARTPLASASLAACWKQSSQQRCKSFGRH